MCVHLQKQIQSSDSDICGLHALFFLVQRLCYGVSFENICKNFKDNVNENDDFIKWYFYVNNVFM